MLKTAHFFAGGGGGILAAEILGHESVLTVEIDERRCEILKQQAEDGWFPFLSVECCDIREFKAEPWAGRVDCIAAGFPCQDISCAGPGEGIKGKRSGLIFELFKAIDVIRPSLVFLENSPRIRTRGRHIVIGELVARGYSWRDGTLAASHVGAGHKRDRWWCLAANADGLPKLEQERRIAEQRGWIGNGIAEITNNTNNRCGPWRPERKIRNRQLEDNSGITSAANTDEIRWNRRSRPKQETPGWIEFTDRLERAFELGGLSDLDAEAIAVAGAYTGAINWSPLDAGVCRVVDGLADRVDRIKTCGDGQVPLQAAVAWILLGWT